MIPVIDLHSDTFMKKMVCESVPFYDNLYIKKENSYQKFSQDFHVNEKAVKKGNLRVQTQSLFIDTLQNNYPLKTALKLIADMGNYVKDKKDYVRIKTKNDFNLCIDNKKYGIFTSIEGLEIIENNLDLLYIFNELGVKIVAPTWNRLLPYMGNVMSGHGLFSMGNELIKIISELNMIIDVSHCSDESFFDIEKKSNSIMIATHSNARSIVDHPRNLSDSQIKIIYERDGVMGLNLAPYFLVTKDDNSLHAFDYLWKMIDYVSSKYSDDIIAFGSDFDGISHLPRGLKDCSFFPDFEKFLLNKGVSSESIEKIFYKNAYRIIKKVLD